MPWCDVPVDKRVRWPLACCRFLLNLCVFFSDRRWVKVNLTLQLSPCTFRCCNAKLDPSRSLSLQGATPDANELRAGKGLADQFGYEVIHQPTASQLRIQGVRTADITVTGI